MAFVKNHPRNCEWCGERFIADYESEDTTCGWQCLARLEAFEASEPERRERACKAVAELDADMAADLKVRVFREVYESPIGGEA